MSVIASGNTTTTALIYTGDTTGNLVFTTGGANTTALTLNNAQSANFTGSLNSTNTFSFKNRIINGNMVIDQRNAGASTTPSADTYLVDRWVYNAGQASKFTWQQNKGAVTPPVGFINYLGGSVASAVSIGSSDYFLLGQKIEGLNVADLGWGTANAKTVTLSFQIYSSLTGTFGGSLLNSAGNRSYPFTYSISSANTWTSISITIAGDTSGTWLTTTGIGISVYFGLGVGSTYSGTAGSWSGSTYYSATSAVSVVGTSSATFYITGVQLETGSQATSFDYRDYGTELIMCQRYGRKLNLEPLGFVYGSSYFLFNGTFYFGITMRTSPTLAAGGTYTIYTGPAGTVGIGPTTAQAVTFSNGDGNWTGGYNVQVTCFLSAEL